MELLQDTVNLRFNQYLRKNVNDEIEVWILPAFQPNATAVFGGEFHYVFSSTGNDLITQDNYCQSNFRGFKVVTPREIWLDFRDVDKPTLGAIFFVWSYKKYFTKINIETSISISTLFEIEGKYNWAHVEKDLSKKKKRKNRKK